MNAWIEDEAKQVEIKDCDRKFEDNFVSSADFQKLDDSEEYLKILENRLQKIKKNSGVLSQLKQKREETINNLLNNSGTITTEDDLELETPIGANKIISNIFPEQPQTVGEIAHLVKNDFLDQQKQDTENLQ